MTQKSMSYDHPAYEARLEHAFGQNAAGASTAFSKFVAFAALTVFGLHAFLITAGTSTYTAWNGTATTTAITGDSLSLIKVTNTSTTNTPALSTSTFGPYALSLYNGTSTGTQTTVAGAFNQYVISGTGGAGSNTGGGISVNPGDTLHVVRGTDATAVIAVAMEYGLTPLANITA